MTETTDITASTSRAPKGKGLGAMLLPELKQLAGGLGIKATGLKKADLVSAIRAAQGASQNSGHNGGQNSGESSNQNSSAGRAPKNDAEPRSAQNGRRNGDQREDSPEHEDRPDRPERSERTEHAGDAGENSQPDRAEKSDDDSGNQGRDHQGQSRGQNKQGGQTRENRDNQSRDHQGQTRNQHQGRDNQGRDNQGRDNQGRDNQGTQTQPQTQARNPGGQNTNFDDGDGSRRNRRRRGRERQGPSAGGTQGGNTNSRGSSRGEPDLQVLEDDILTPAAGILDLMDNYAFVRTSGYLPGSDDVYVSLSMVRKFGLRRGDAITGQVRQPREGEQKAKFNPLVALDTVNGADPESAKDRVEFSKLTPLYASERLRLETTPTNLIGRVIDIAAPIGKGQRGLIVSPSKAGKTMIMQSIANSITTNNPECHLMVVLVDERPEEVTDFERSVKGEVISSTFDRPATDHTIVAELAIERAKRLVELGHDVVVLLDGITRLGRAYNLAAPASGRILSGGVDSAALYPPKRFFGAARNIEDGGSLTILATALIESGSKMDEVIFEEFKGTGNMEIRLRRDFADKRIFPAIDAVQSGTRREELLMSKEELAIVWKLRRVLSALDGQQALELLLERLKKSQNNLEFLMQVQKTTPGTNGD
ncbi:MAG: transcription termination factor Rho [Marmoricola sp.]|nr:transcription termination factor Rho [Marmoricola sp.]